MIPRLAPYTNVKKPQTVFLTEEQKKFVRDNAQNMNVNQLATEIGSTWHVVNRFCKEENITTGTHWRKPEKKPVSKVKEGYFDIDNFQY